MKQIWLLKSKTREKILRFFFKNKEKKYYLRELEKILKIPVGNIRRELISLKELGLFKQKKTGNLMYYSLNKDSPFFEIIEKIISISTPKKKKTSPEKFKKENSLILIKKEELDLLKSKINELENIFKTLSVKHSETKDLLNLGIVVNEHGKVLLVKRIKEEMGKNKSILTWAFPGGRQKPNETRRECVSRSVLSETGYKIKPIMEISLRSHPQFPVFIVYHLCRLVSSKPVAKPKEPHEIAEIKWVNPEEIKKMFTTNFDAKVKKELGLD